jgi:hypothetical protein
VVADVGTEEARYVEQWIAEAIRVITASHNADARQRWATARFRILTSGHRVSGGKAHFACSDDWLRATLIAIVLR